MVSKYEVIIIGAGHAGLGVGRTLQERGISHVILERGRIGESWRTQRWDSFQLNTPRRISVPYGETYTGADPDGFMHANEFVASLEAYVREHNLPVTEHARVTAVVRDATSGYYDVTVARGETTEHLQSRAVIVASGITSEPNVPTIADTLPDSIVQHSGASYRNPGQLPSGAVLVVGAAQSGCQIAEELLLGGHKVYLTTGKVGRAPRRYRGKDITEWFYATGFFTQSRSTVPPEMLRMPQPQVSGVGPLGHSVSLQFLHSHGTVILGRLRSIEGTMW
jgi:putative flavoprotein involved in K+ transport